MSVPRRYTLLRAIAFLLKLFAWVALVFGILAAIASLIVAAGPALRSSLLPEWTRWLGLAIGPVVGVIWFVQLYAFGSILSLLVDIEENTRLLTALPAAGEPVSPP